MFTKLSPAKQKQKMKALKVSRSIPFGEPNVNRGSIERLQCPPGTHVTRISGHYGMVGMFRTKETLLDVCLQCSDGSQHETVFPQPFETRDKVPFQHESKEGY